MDNGHYQRCHESAGAHETTGAYSDLSNSAARVPFCVESGAAGCGLSGASGYQVHGACWLYQDGRVLCVGLNDLVAKVVLV